MKSVKAAQVLALGIIATISIGGYINQNVQASDIVFEDGEEEPVSVDEEITVPETEDSNQSDLGAETTDEDGEEEPVSVDEEITVPETEDSNQSDFEAETTDETEVESDVEDSEEVSFEENLDASEGFEDGQVESEEKNGECGVGENKIYWTLGNDHVLKIEGQGEMQDWNIETDVPWNKYQLEIEQIEVDNGITSIGAYAFYDCVNVMKVEIPESVDKIGMCAFFNCNGLSTLTIG